LVTSVTGVASSTWWNLPEGKRERITEVAMQEFGEHGFSAGSLNVIARGAGIAKGSLFQYFDDKLDLYVTVCEQGASEIERHMLGAVHEEAPFFDNLRAIVEQWMSYFRSHPLQRRMAYASTHEVDPQVRAVVRALANAHYESALGPLVRLARERGELRAGVDERMVMSLLSVVLRHLNSAPFDTAGDVAIPFHRLSDVEVDRWALAYLDVLEAAFAT
jgi:AcrR family transcriptional regulator